VVRTGVRNYWCVQVKQFLKKTVLFWPTLFLEYTVT
jgi:hypothetical protein